MAWRSFSRAFREAWLSRPNFQSLQHLWLATGQQGAFGTRRVEVKKLIPAFNYMLFGADHYT